jgi:hypothetical protein
VSEAQNADIKLLESVLNPRMTSFRGYRLALPPPARWLVRRGGDSGQLSHARESISCLARDTKYSREREREVLLREKFLRV